MKEHLVGAEDRRNYIRIHSSFLELRKIIVPKLVLDENGSRRLHRIQKSPGIAAGVHRQIKHCVGTAVVLPKFIARRREKRQDDKTFRRHFPNPFYQRSCLLKLPYGRAVEPDSPSIPASAHLLLNTAYDVLPTGHEECGLMIEKAQNPGTEEIHQNAYIV